MNSAHALEFYTTSASNNPSLIAGLHRCPVSPCAFFSSRFHRSPEMPAPEVSTNQAGGDRGGHTTPGRIGAEPIDQDLAHLPSIGEDALAPVGQHAAAAAFSCGTAAKDVRTMKGP